MVALTSSYILALMPLKPEGHIHMDITWWNRSGLYGWRTTCQHIDHIKSLTIQALLGWAWLCNITSFMSMPNTLLIACECLRGFHTSTVHWWWFQSPSTLSRQRTFDSNWTKMPRLKWYSHYSSNLGSYSWRWSISWSVGWMTASMPMGTL